MKEKKGIALSQAFSAVLIVVLVAVLIIIAIFLFATLRDTFPDQAESTINETSWVNRTPYIVDNSTACGAGTFVLTGAMNISNNFQLNLANVTMNSVTGAITNATPSEFNDTVINYTYTWKGPGCSASDNMTSEFATYIALIGLVGTIIFLGIVIGVLVGSFVFGRREI